MPAANHPGSVELSAIAARQRADFRHGRPQGRQFCRAQKESPAAAGPSFALGDQPRQEPGRNFEGMSVPSVVEPQRQPYRDEPTFAANVAAVFAADSGASVPFLVSMFESLNPCAVTVTTPST